MNGAFLEWASSIKHLGIFLNNKLSSIAQKRTVLRKMNRFHGAFYGKRNYMPLETLMTTYSIAYPAIIQNVTVWGAISNSNTCNLKIAMNEILRCILNLKKDRNNIPIIQFNIKYV